MRRTGRPWPVEFTVEGVNLERFIRQAGEAGVRVTGIRRPSRKRLTAQAAEEQLPLLQTLAGQGGWALCQGSRQGVGTMLQWMRKRWLFCIGLTAAVLALILAAQVVWRVDVENGGAYAADIRAALAELGVEAPMLRRSVDLGELRDALEWRYPRIAWFECGWRGSTLVIRPEEGVLPHAEHTYNGACDVVAARDGVVHTIITKAGTPVVKPGDIIRAGDVLIKGEERTAGGEVKPVAARGSVTARVWEGASVRMSAYETITAYTGRQETVWTIRTPWFDLWPMEKPVYAQYDTTVSETPVCGIFFPAVLHVETRMEADIIRQMCNIDDLKAQAYEAAQQKLHEKVGAEESLIDIWGNCSMIDDENVLSVAIGEIRMEIGLQQRSSGMAAPEKGEP